MITKNNYIQKLKSVDLAAAPQVIKEGHEYALKMIEKGYYEKSATVKETIDLYLEKLNEYVGKSNVKAAQPKRKNKVRQKANVDTKKATQARINQKKETAKGEVKKTKPRKATVPKVEKVLVPRVKKTPVPKVKKEPTTVKKIGKRVPAETEAPKRLNSINKIYRLAATYLRMDNKLVSHAKVLNLFQSLQNYIIEFKPKSDTLRGEVTDYLQHQLYMLESTSRVKKGITLKIQAEDKKRLEVYSNVTLAKAVSLIRRYIALPDHKSQAMAAGKLLKDINEAIDKKELSIRNKRYEFIQEIKSRLENKNYSPTKTMLAGLQGWF